MKDRERAERLAKAIEEMVQGRTPEGLDDEELQELLKIARIRLDAAHLAADRARESENAVLERLIARLETLQHQTRKEPSGTPTIDNNLSEPTPTNDGANDFAEVQHVIDLRRRVAEETASIAQQHRETVWHRVQARITAEESAKRGLFRWPFRKRDREAEEFGLILDRVILGEPIWEAENSRFGELLQVARARQAATAGAGLADQQARVWARLRPRLMARLAGLRSGVFQPRPAAVWPKLAVAGAALAVVAAVLAPLPVTGPSGHPVAAAVRFVGERIGVSETTAPPPVSPVTEVVDGQGASAAEASRLLGLPVFEPTFVPEGFEKATSRYYSEPITADEGGVFFLAYQSPTDGTILIYQEAASGNRIAVLKGFAQDLVLPGGTAATWVDGTWTSGEGQIAWGGEEARTIVFELNGVRTIIRSTGSVSNAELVSVATSLATQTDTAPTD